MSEREPAYVWVKWRGRGMWETAVKHHDCQGREVWNVYGVARDIDPSEFAEIGPRISPPCVSPEAGSETQAAECQQASSKGMDEDMAAILTDRRARRRVDV